MSSSLLFCVTDNLELAVFDNTLTPHKELQTIQVNNLDSKQSNQLTLLLYIAAYLRSYQQPLQQVLITGIDPTLIEQPQAVVYKELLGDLLSKISYQQEQASLFGSLESDEVDSLKIERLQQLPELQFFKPLDPSSLKLAELQHIQPYSEPQDFNEFDYIVYTDGSSISQTLSGFAVVVINQQGQVFYHNQRYFNSTNNRMELNAILYAMHKLAPYAKVKIYSDSEYSVKSYNLWVDKWHQNNYSNRKNPDLVKQFYQLKHSKFANNISLVWVKAHNGNYYNELADYLAQPDNCDISQTLEDQLA